MHWLVQVPWFLRSRTFIDPGWSQSERTAHAGSNHLAYVLLALCSRKTSARSSCHFEANVESYRFNSWPAQTCGPPTRASGQDQPFVRELCRSSESIRSYERRCWGLPWQRDWNEIISIPCQNTAKLRWIQVSRHCAQKTLTNSVVWIEHGLRDEGLRNDWQTILLRARPVKSWLLHRSLHEGQIWAVRF